MNICSSVITLLLASAAAANDAHDIMAQPHIASIVNSVQQGDPDADYPCKAEVLDVFKCLGDVCVDCFVDIFDDFTNSTTCASLGASTTFCDDIKGCIVICGDTDCTESAKALEACAAQEYPDNGDSKESPCPGLCEADEDDVPFKVPASTDVSSFVHTANDAHDIMAQPHIARIVNSVQQGDPDADYPCKAEVLDVFKCLGDVCIDCFVDIFDDFTNSTTCASLGASTTFCHDIKGCIVICGDTDCTESAKVLEACAAQEYPDNGDSKESPCPGLCEADEDEKSFTTYKIA